MELDSFTRYSCIHHQIIISNIIDQTLYEGYSKSKDVRFIKHYKMHVLKKKYTYITFGDLQLGVGEFSAGGA